VRLLLIGDIVGKNGEKFVTQHLPAIRRSESLDFVIANAENVEDGSGLREASYRRLIVAGVDVITMGDHIFKKKEIMGVLDTKTNIIRPANFPPEAPGKGWTIAKAADDTPVAVASFLGRVFMRPVDCPFRAANQVVSEIPPEVKVRIVDFHAEATSDKQLMGRHLDGRVSAVLGTHTHVPTADEQILPQGTAFQCDVGMTGAHDSILGRQIDPVLYTTLSFRPSTFHVATGNMMMHGSIVDIDPSTGRATAIRRFVLNEADGKNLLSPPNNSLPA
jgi:2',3'-cyclic-nucleotide 2'-phosphodiesterase